MELTRYKIEFTIFKKSEHSFKEKISDIFDEFLHKSIVTGVIESIKHKLDIILKEEGLSEFRYSLSIDESNGTLSIQPIRKIDHYILKTLFDE